MPNEFETALKNTAASVAKYVQDVATLQVETRYVDVGGESTPAFDQARPVSRSIIRLDGDSETVVPMRKGASGALEVDSALFELHQQNVATAIDYRARMLAALLSILPSRTRPTT
jgi:hypothetical protein